MCRSVISFHSSHSYVYLKFDFLREKWEQGKGSICHKLRTEKEAVVL